MTTEPKLNRTPSLVQLAFTKEGKALLRVDRRLAELIKEREPIETTDQYMYYPFKPELIGDCPVIEFPAGWVDADCCPDFPRGKQ